MLLSSTLVKMYRWVRNLKRKIDRYTRWPPIGAIDFGDLRRVKPISKDFSFDRGKPVDRYYIEKFLQQHSRDIQGRVLEVGDSEYTRKFGESRVAQSDVLHVNLQKPDVTFVGDLANASHIPSDAFDCFILTQTLQLIYELRDAIKNIYRILKPGGILLATFPGISQVANPGFREEWSDQWRFTAASAQRMFAEFFPSKYVHVQAQGNVLVAISFLHGLAMEELSPEELDYHDANFEVLLTVRAEKPQGD
jgi:SAM-dependent methyltransferase